MEDVDDCQLEDGSEARDLTSVAAAATDEK